MFQIRAYVAPAHVDTVVSLLDAGAGVSYVLRVGTTEGGETLVTADVDADAADALFEVLAERLPSDALALVRVDGVEAPGRRRSRWLARDVSTLAWTEVVAEARASSRLLSRYLALMAVAGVIAGVGVIEASTILIIGAMAISPDLLPLAAACVGLVGGRPRLVGRSLRTLVVGLGLGSVSAAAGALLLQAVGTYSGDPDAGVLHGLTTTDATTIVVALAAGVAAMLTYESRAGAAVGVAISVTTIPASAYLGVAAASAERSDALGALGVLATNLVCLLAAGTTTLVIQRRLRPTPDPGPLM